MRFPDRCDVKEIALLIELYEVPNGTYSSYTLAEKLNPGVELGTESPWAAFAETRDVTENLIAKGLVQGERKRGPDGIYFEKLKLTSKGEQTAIQQRNSAKETETSLNEVLKEIRKSTDNK